MRNLFVVSVASLTLFSSAGVVLADEIQPYQSQTIQPYQSQTIQPYQSQTIQPDQSQPVMQIPSAPTGVTANVGDTQVVLSWNASSGATSYKVYENGANIAYDVASTSYTVTGLTNGTSYSFRIIAVNSSGESAQSDIVTATPQAQATQSAQSTQTQQYQSQPIQQYQSQPIQQYQSQPIQQYQSQPIQQYQSQPVQQYQSQPVQPNQPKKFILLQLSNEYTVVNGQYQTVDTKPYESNGRTLVPIRFISEALGAKVDWDQQAQQITITMNGKSISLWINKPYANINGVNQSLDVAPRINNSRTMVPLRFITENLNQKVDFDSSTQSILIQSNDDASITSFQSNDIKPYITSITQMNKPSQLPPALPPVSSDHSPSKGSSDGSIFSPADQFRYSGGTGSDNFWNPGWLNPGGGY
jgi:phage baseplate assembly protein gpV